MNTEQSAPVGSGSSEGLGGERAAFEAWGRAAGLEDKAGDRGMNYPLGDHLWVAWQARASAVPQPAPVEAIREVVRISDRSHPAWDEVKAWLAAAPSKEGK